MAKAMAAFLMLVAVQAGAAVVLPDGKAAGRVQGQLQSLVVQVRGRAVLGRQRQGSVDLFEVESAGSGVLVERGLVLADLHTVMVVLKDGSRHGVGSIEVTVAGAGTFPAVPLAGDPILDIVILQLGGPGASLPGATLAQRSPLPGEQLLSLTATDRGVSSRQVTVDRVERAANGAAQLYFSPHFDQHDFGAALFDARGDLAGLGAPLTDDLCGGVPVEHLRLLLERSRSPRGLQSDRSATGG